MSAADIARILDRLESITARLESVENGQGGGGGGGASSSSVGGAPPVDDGEVAPMTAAFDDLIAEYMTVYMDLSGKIGGKVAEQAAVFQQAINAQRTFIDIVSKCAEPSEAVMASLIPPMGGPIGQVMEIRESSRGDEFFNHLSAMSEAVPALGWIQSKKTAPHVEEMSNAGEFYLNRVLKDAPNDDHKTWVRNLKAFWVALKAYVKQYHTTGPAWARNGGDASQYAGAAVPAAAPAAAPAASGRPAARPAPATASTGAPAGAGLFAELNQGGAVTSGLKKVDRSQMTHKNPELRKTAVVKAKSGPKRVPKYAQKKAKGAPVFELQRNTKWTIENQDDREDLIVEEPRLNHTVYVYKCDNCVVQVNAKCNSIVLDTCSRVGLVFEACVSVVEVINCKAIKVQVKQSVPAINVDKTSGVQIFLSETSLNTEIVTAKTDEANVVLPPRNDDEDITEIAIPEQFLTKVNAEEYTTTTTTIEHV